jgi:hypothetical protein
MKVSEKCNVNTMRHQIKLIDERIERLNRTGGIYLQDHGVKHAGIEKLITALVNERAVLSKKILKAH